MEPQAKNLWSHGRGWWFGDIKWAIRKTGEVFREQVQCYCPTLESFDPPPTQSGIQGQSDLAAPLGILRFWCSFIIAIPQTRPAGEILQVHFIPFGRKKTAPNKEQFIIFKGNLRTNTN